MVRTIMLLACCTMFACAGDQERNPYLPGGGTGTGSTSDAGIGGGGDGGAGYALTGSVCQFSTLRLPGNCKAAPRGVAIVERDSPYKDVTDVDGNFRMSSIGGVRTTLEASNDDLALRPTLVSVPLTNDRAANITVPIQDADEFELELLGSDIINQPTTATVVFLLRYNGAPATGATVDVPGSGGTLPHYDVAGPIYWDPASGGTGTLGSALIASIPANLRTVTIAVNYNDTSKNLSVPVAPDTTTFVQYDFATDVY